MSVGITKNGNPYKKSNIGKVVASGVGAAVGGYWASKNTHFIKRKINDIYIKSAKMVVKGFWGKIKDALTGKMDSSSLNAGSKFIVKIAKFGIKCLNSIKKHPVAAGAIVGAVASSGIGALIDKKINQDRAKEADKK